MTLLEGKTALVFGVANDHSIAWGISKAMHDQGARLAFSYAIDSLERRVRPLAESIGSDFIEKCDVTQDDEIRGVFEKAKQALGKIDVLVHAVAFAERDDLMGRFVDTSRTGFHTAMDISVYSFCALAREAAPLMSDGGSMMTMTYYGSEKVSPNYNVMGVAKAALEATTRYLAADLGPLNIRVNAILPIWLHCDATLASKTLVARPFGSPPIWPAPSLAKSCLWMRATISWGFRTSKINPVRSKRGSASRPCSGACDRRSHRESNSNNGPIGPAWPNACSSATSSSWWAGW
jgi:enoyl-[acyl-carrier protein] reductase I